MSQSVLQSLAFRCVKYIILSRHLGITRFGFQTGNSGQSRNSRNTLSALWIPLQLYSVHIKRKHGGKQCVTCLLVFLEQSIQFRNSVYFVHKLSRRFSDSGCEFATKRDKSASLYASVLSLQSVPRGWGRGLTEF